MRAFVLMLGIMLILIFAAVQCGNAGNWEVQTADTAQTQLTLTVLDGLSVTSIEWSSNGNILAWVERGGSSKNSAMCLYRTQSGKNTRITYDCPIISIEWHPQEPLLLVSSGCGGSNPYQLEQILVSPLGCDKTPWPATLSGRTGRAARFSNEGEWLAYISRGSTAIMLCDSEGLGAQTLTSGAFFVHDITWLGNSALAYYTDVHYKSIIDGGRIAQEYRFVSLGPEGNRSPHLIDRSSTNKHFMASYAGKKKHLVYLKCDSNGIGKHKYKNAALWEYNASSDKRRLLLKLDEFAGRDLVNFQIAACDKLPLIAIAISSKDPIDAGTWICNLDKRIATKVLDVAASALAISPDGNRLAWVDEASENIAIIALSAQNQEEERREPPAQ